MTQTQKVIKYVAIIFGICLAVSIISSIIYGIVSFASIFTNESNIKDSEFVILPTLDIDSEDIISLDIDLPSSNLNIMYGDEFKVSTNDEDVIVDKKASTLIIDSKKKNHFTINNTKSIVNITVPRDLTLENIYLELGAGKLTINEVNANNIRLDAGASNTYFNNLSILNKASIKGGVGKLEIKGGEISLLDLELGVGDVTVNTFLGNGSKIEAGIGSLKLILPEENMYAINVSKGIGSISLNGKQINGEDNVYGNGNNNISIEGGIGSIDISFAK